MGRNEWSRECELQANVLQKQLHSLSLTILIIIFIIKSMSDENRIEIRHKCEASRCPGFQCHAVTPKVCSKCGEKDTSHQLLGYLHMQTRQFTYADDVTESAFYKYYTPLAALNKQQQTTIPSYSDFLNHSASVKTPFVSQYQQSASKPKGSALSPLTLLGNP